MDEKLSIRAKYSVDDYVRVLTYMQSQFFVNKYGLIIAPIGVVLVATFFVFSLQKSNQNINLLVIFLPALLMGIILGGVIFLSKKFLNPLILKYKISKQYNSSPAMQAENNFTLSNEGINNDNGLTSGTVRWDAIVRAVETQSDFLFYTSNRFAQFVPKRIFDSETDINFIRCLARAKLGDKAKF